MTSRVGGPIQPGGMAISVKPQDEYTLMFKDGVWQGRSIDNVIADSFGLVVVDAASPTELNNYGSASGELLVVAQEGAASNSATLYRLDASSDAQSLPYIVSSATAGYMWVAVAGRYVNGEATASTGFTGPHMRALSSAGLLLENSNGDDVALLGAGPGTGTTFYGGVILDAETASRIVVTGAGKDLDTPASISTAQTVTLSAGSGTSLAISSTTDSSSKDTGSIVTEGGAGIEKTAYIGDLLRVLGSSGTNTVIEAGSNSKASSTYINMNAAAGQTRAFAFQSGGSFRWLVSCSNTAETGSDAGSNFAINAYSDAGGFIDTPMTIARLSGGTITIVRPVTLSTASNGLTISKTTGTTLSVQSTDTSNAVGLSGGLTMATGKNLRIGTAAVATNATDGFVYVSTCAGTPTGTPTTLAGTAPIVIDTTNNKLYFYSGGAWRDAGP